MNATTRVGLGLLITCAAVWGQASTAQINGTIRDASGLAVPSAEIKVTQTATGAGRTAISGADGGYVLTNLPIGPYLLEVTKEGFSKYAQTGIVLQVDSNPTVDAALKVGAVTEQVMVQADAALVETRSTGVGTVVDNQRVAEMPLNGRNPIELVFLAGMANYPGNGAINTVRNYPTVIVSVAGGQGNGVAYLLDGATHQDPYNNLALPLPFPDALQEFKVETSALPAQYGFHAGAAVNAVTKSGTNSYHGDLFEFVRNGDFNARDFFATTRDTLKRNQYGGTIGGPVLPRFKDKLFFFFGYQDTTQRSDPNSLPAFVPTAAMLGGDFTTFASPFCNQGAQKTLSSAFGFVSNKISPALLNPVALNIAKTMPTPINGCGATTYGLVSGQDENLYVARIDYQQSPKNTIFGRFTAANLNVPSTYNGVNPLSINTYGVHDLDYSLALGDTYVFGANIVNSLRVAASRANVAKVPDNYGNLATFGSTNFTPLGGKVMSFTVTGGGGFNIGTSASVPGQSHDGPNPSIADDLSWVHGAHQFGFGGSIYRQGMNYWSGLNAVGSMAFNGSNTGLGMADFLIGETSNFSQGITYGFYNRQYYIALYAQDSWKVSKRLTLNYGVRWEPYTAPWSKYGQFSHFDPALFAAGVHSTVFTGAPAGLVFPGDSQYACGNSINCPQWNKFFPRIGVVWDPFGDSKMTIRASYGMFGDRNHMFYSNFTSQYAPFGNTVTQSVVNITDPWKTYPGGNPVGALAAQNGIGHASPTAVFPAAGSFIAEQLQNYKAPYMNQWNLSIQRQVGTDWLLSANYLGNNQIHLTTSNLLNPAVYLGMGPCTINTVNAAGAVVPTSYSTCSTTANQQQRRVLSLQNPAAAVAYGAMAYQDDGGTGTYDALNFALQKRLSKGVTASANYTWSHCISDVQDQQTSASGVQAVPGNRRADRSNCIGIDVRHNFILNMVLQTPKFSTKWLHYLAGDWQIAPILRVSSAQQFSITSGTDRALTTATTQNGNLVLPGSVYASNQSVNGWVNPAAFAIPALGNYGNIGVNNIKGPGIVQLNMAFSRTFPIHERMAVQIRAEAFNLPNLLNGSVPVGALNNSLFGTITSDISGNNGLTNNGDPRIIQLAAKFVF